MSGYAVADIFQNIRQKKWRTLKGQRCSDRTHPSFSFFKWVTSSPLIHHHYYRSNLKCNFSHLSLIVDLVCAVHGCTIKETKKLRLVYIVTCKTCMYMLLRVLTHSCSSTLCTSCGSKELSTANRNSANQNETRKTLDVNCLPCVYDQGHKIPI